MKLVFATNNPNKLKEIQSLLGDKITLLSLKDIECFDEIPEDHETLSENASQKAYHVYDKYGYDCFADDTGLEIEALDGEPGVYSARYAGVDKDFQANMDKVLEKMQGKTNRNACFRTVVSLVIEGKEVQFEGRVDGHILENEQGGKGFGYDPIFMANSEDISFAEMTMEAKNKISHRGRAVSKLVDYLKTL